jgi:hypothetical protein
MIKTIPAHKKEAIFSFCQVIEKEQDMPSWGVKKVSTGSETRLKKFFMVRSKPQE